ncbi:MAG: hypothetical protein ABDI20_09555 [Candidatus Bipolaricaulaceae bacterium]
MMGVFKNKEGRPQRRANFVSPREVGEWGKEMVKGLSERMMQEEQK